MSTPALLGIDLGTTGCKAALYTPDGTLLGSAYLEYGLSQPAPGHAEQDAEEWWALTCRAIREALATASVSGERVAALSVSSQGISFVPIDADGQPLGPAITWLDTRASAEAAAITARYSLPTLYRLTGKRASAVYVLPKLLWLRQHCPDLYREAAAFLLAHDFLVRRFSGRLVTDHSLAGGTLLYDVTRLAWSDELLAAFDLSPARLPTVRWAGTPVGPILPHVADRLGLGHEALVIVGGQDQKCAALGARIRPGVATVSLGTATAISVLADHPAFEREARIPLFPFVVPGYWDLEGVVGTAGAALKWLRGTLFPHMSYDALTALAASSPPGANGVRFYPHLAGATSPHWQPDAHGAYLGLQLATGAGDIVRALLEGVAFQIRTNLAIMEETAGEVEALVLFGGGARSALWREIIAAVTGKPVALALTPDIAGWGAALLAGVGAGLIEHRLSRTAARSGVPFQASSAAIKQYDGLYSVYRQEERMLLAATGA